MYMPLDLILIYFFLIGIVTDLVSIQDPLFICERTAFDKLVAGLLDPCICGYTKWVACSYKQVRYYRTLWLLEPLPPPKK